MQHVYKLDAQAHPVPCDINDPDLHAQLAAGLFCVGSSQIGPAWWVLTSFDMLAGHWRTDIDTEGLPCHGQEALWPTLAQAFDGHRVVMERVRTAAEASA